MTVILFIFGAAVAAALVLLLQGWFRYVRDHHGTWRLFWGDIRGSFGQFPTGGTGPVSTLASLTNADNLQTVPVFNLPDGFVVWVIGELAFYRLDKLSGATLSSPDIVSAFGGPTTARWFRLALSPTLNPALQQAAWFVDSVSGNDANDGKTSGTALKTIGEIMKRWGPDPLLQPASFPVRITVLSATLLATDEPYFDNVRSLVVATPTPNLVLQGTVTAGATLGAVTSVTAITRTVADGALLVTIGAITWPAARTRLRIQGGARDGAVAYVVTPNTAAGQARTSPFWIVPADVVFDMTLAGATEVTPQFGDTIIVETISRSQLPLQINDCALNFTVQQMRFDDDAAFTFTNVAMLGSFLATFSECSFGDGVETESGQTCFNNCDGGTYISATPQFQRALGGMSTNLFGTCFQGFAGILDCDVVLSGGNIVGLTGDVAPNVLVGNCAVYGNTAQAVFTLFADGVIRIRPFDQTTGVLYGTGNQRVYRVRSATGKFLIDDIATEITIVGTTDFALIAGRSLATKQLYPQDNKGNLIATPASDPTTELAREVYPIGIRRGVRGVCTTNVASLAAFTCSGAGRDNITYQQDDEICLLGQTTATQDGPYIVGVVTANVAPLTRPDWWQTGATIPDGISIAVQEGAIFQGAIFQSETRGAVVDTNDPLLYPDRIIQNVTLGNGTFDITNVPIRANTARVGVAITRTTPAGTNVTIQYNASAIVAGQLGAGTQKVTVEAEIAAGTINAADTSHLQVAIIQ